MSAQHKALFDIRFDDKYFLAINALGLAFSFLESRMLHTTHLRLLEYRLLSDDAGEAAGQRTFMSMETPVIEHLEMLEKDGLHDILNQTKTKFGR